MELLSVKDEVHSDIQIAKAPNVTTPYYRGRALMSSERFFSMIIFLFICALFTVSVTAQVGTSTEYKFKAAYLYNFLRFVEWPHQAFADKASPIVIGVLSNDAFSTLVEQTVNNETIRGRAVVVRRLSGIEGAKSCHILFISRSEQKNLHEILDMLKGKPVLTVGEIGAFARSGGAINFYFEGNKLRFEINPEAAKSADLVLSSKLLRLAKIVEPEK